MSGAPAAADDAGGPENANLISACGHAQAGQRNRAAKIHG